VTDDVASGDPPRAPAKRLALSQRQRFLLAAFMVITFFVVLQVRGLLSSRSPEARLDAILATVGAEQVGLKFDPAVHDRALERPPWSKVQGPLYISDYADQVVFLNYWATWCEPCIRELPSMLRLARRLLGQKFVMLAVSYDESWEDVRSFFDRVTGGGEPPPELVLARDPLMATDPLRARYGTDKLPETYIVADGQVLHRFIAAHDWMAAGKLEYFDLLLQAESRR
jgi:thiol-disulfide isomerase/thioredoxin